MSNKIVKPKDYFLLKVTYVNISSRCVNDCRNFHRFGDMLIRTNFVLFHFHRFILTNNRSITTAHGRTVLCGQHTSGVYSTKICDEPFGSGKVKLIDVLIDNWYRKNS
jgi:hypothetical protein